MVEHIIDPSYHLPLWEGKRKFRVQDGKRGKTRASAKTCPTLRFSSWFVMTEPAFISDPVPTMVSIQATGTIRSSFSVLQNGHRTFPRDHHQHRRKRQLLGKSQQDPPPTARIRSALLSLAALAPSRSFSAVGFGMTPGTSVTTLWFFLGRRERHHRCHFS